LLLPFSFLADLLAGWLGSRVVCKQVGYGSAASAVGIINLAIRLAGWLASASWLAVVRLWFGWFGWLAGWLSLAMVRLAVALFIIKRLVYWWVVCCAVCLA
jgi:hypothetical protein